MPLQKYVLFDETYGVMLRIGNIRMGGEELQVALWSHVDCNGLDKTVVLFDTPEDAWLFISRLDVTFDEIRPVKVTVEHPDFAVIPELTRVGLPAWYPPMHDCVSKCIN